MAKCARWKNSVISIHALREEGDQLSTSRRKKTQKFLSTPSARRATASLTLKAQIEKIFLSTPSARRATPQRGFFAGHA